MAQTQQTGRHKFGRIDADEVRRAITIRRVLWQISWRERPRRRFDCGLCQRGHRGHSTVSFTDKLWHCHRCKAGGDVFELIKLELRCDFTTALKYAADLAGIRPAAPETREQYEKRKRERELQREQDEQVERVGDYLEHRARVLRNLALEYLHFFEGVVRSASLTLKDDPEDEPAWAALISADKIVRSFDAKYRLLAFGPAQLRADYILNPRQRETITNELLELAGFRDDGLRDDDEGHWWEVG